MNKITLGILFGIISITGVLIFSFISKEKYTGMERSLYSIQKTWELPEILNEVSGIAWLGDQRVALIQDEDGIIFIYDLSSSRIEDRIEFAGPGDYEGIAVVGDTAYIIRSDGSIFRVENFQTRSPIITKFDTYLNSDQNVEGICLDTSRNRLLLAIKDEESDRKDYKGIYEFSLENHKLEHKPVFELDMNDKLLAGSNSKPSKRFRPSEIAVHPINGDIHILDAKDPRMLVLDNSFNIKNVYILNEDDFNQPEGLSIHPDGNILISNEAGDQPANIHKVIFQKISQIHE